MPDTTFRFVFQDGGGGDGPRPPGGASRTPRPGSGPAPGGSGPSAPPSSPRPPGGASQAGGGKGSPDDPLTKIIGSQGQQFLERFGFVLNRLPFFTRALDLMRLIAGRMPRGFGADRPQAAPSGSAAAVGGRSQIQTESVAPAGRGRQARRQGSSAVDRATQAADASRFVRDAWRRLPGRAPQPSAPRAPSGRIVDGRVLSRSVAPTAGRIAGPVASGGRALATAGAGTGSGALAAGGAGGALAAGGTGAAGGAAAGGGALAAAGPVGIAILAVVAVVGAAVLAVKALTAVNDKLKDHFKPLSDRLEKYSAQIQAANARIAVRNTRDEVQFSRELGGRLSRFNESQAKIDRALGRIARTIEGPVLDAITPIVENIGGRLEQLAFTLDVAIKSLDQVGAFKNSLIELVKIENKLLKFAEDEANEIPPESDILGLFNKALPLSVEWAGKTYGADEEKAVAGRPDIEIPGLPAAYLE